jgi:hypothetical protein
MSTLIANVQVDGVWYGPAHGSTEVGAGVPVEVAAQIGAHAWSDGLLPADVVLPQTEPEPLPDPAEHQREPAAEPQPTQPEPEATGRRGRGRSKG